MNNYFRITAYHPAENLSVIADSNGKFENLWEFSAYMVSKGFKVIAVSKEEGFENGNMPKIAPDVNHITIQSIANGKPDIINNKISVSSGTYFIKGF